VRPRTLILSPFGRLASMVSPVTHVSPGVTAFSTTSDPGGIGLVRVPKGRRPSSPQTVFGQFLVHSRQATRDSLRKALQLVRMFIVLSVVGAVGVQMVGLSAAQAGGPVTGATYVALGDSYAAGEGLGGIGVGYEVGTAIDPSSSDPAKNTNGNKNTCHRSNSGAYGSLGNSSVLKEIPTSSRAHWACSGAWSTDMMLNPSQLPITDGRFQFGQPVQTSTVSGATRFVTVSAGGNDMGFGDLGKSCAGLREANGSTTGIPGASPCATQIASSLVRLSNAESNLVSLYKSILSKAPNAALVVVGYPKVFPGPSDSYAKARPTADGKGFCATNSFPIDPTNGVYVYLGATVENAVALDGIIRSLNDTAQRAVATAKGGSSDYASRIRFADTYSSSTPHDCSGYTKGVSVNGVMASGTFNGGGPLNAVSSATFHPTSEGQAMMAGVVDGAFDPFRLRYAGAPVDITTGVGVPVGVSVPFTGGFAPVKVLAVSSNYPSWLSVSVVNHVVVLRGTPKVSGTWSLVLSLTDSAYGSTAISVHITSAPVPPVLPAQPANPNVTATSTSSAALVWTDASNNETGFVSQYRIGTGAWVTGPSVGANATSMTVNGLSPNTTYTFQVGAQNTAGTKWSAYFNGTTAAVPVLPAQPANPNVTATSTGSAFLAWTDASNNETGFVSQYRIGTGAWVTGPSVGANATSMTVNGLSPNTTYTFQVGAQNTAGTKWSAYFNGTTSPAQPANPIVTATSTASAALAWTSSATSQTGFVSQYRIGTGAWVTGPSVGANATSMTVNGLSPNTTYTFQVGAQNSVGTIWSAYFNGTTAAVPVLPAQPANPNVTATSTSSAALVWTDASNNETGFVSQYRIGTGAWVAGPSASANATSMTVNGLSPSTTYTFQVGAQNSVGTKWSTYFNGTTAAVPPPPPSYHAGRQVTIDSHATGGVSGHTGPSDSYAAGPTRPANSALWIVCYVNGQSITGPYNTTTIWDLSDDGYYYTDAWVYTGTNGPAVPACAPKTVAIDSHATGGVSGHRGPDNSYAAGPTHQVNSGITIFCYVDGQSITGPYNTTTIWDLSNDGYYYTDAWIYTGTNGAAVPHC
jgi:hypothetical protein